MVDSEAGGGEGSWRAHGYSHKCLQVASLEQSTRWMRPVKQGVVVAECTVLHKGTRVAFLEARLKDTAGATLCVAQQTLLQVAIHRKAKSQKSKL